MVIGMPSYTNRIMLHSVGLKPVVIKNSHLTKHSRFHQRNGTHTKKKQQLLKHNGETLNLCFQLMNILSFFLSLHLLRLLVSKLHLKMIDMYIPMCCLLDVDEKAFHNVPEHLVDN